jgi:putative oxidoreductase
MSLQGSAIPLIGRILMCPLFLASGYGKATRFDATVAYITSAGMPMPTVAAIIAIVVEILGPLCLIFGFKVRIVAWIMALYSVAAACYFHKFWAVPPEQYAGQFNNFFKNVAIAGGLLYIAAFGAGPNSIDQRSEKG